LLQINIKETAEIEEYNIKKIKYKIVIDINKLIFNCIKYYKKNSADSFILSLSQTKIISLISLFTTTTTTTTF